ncbi:aldehyde dehydrogenase family protein [Ornithinimicrobium faecis]|uniref:Aldehyde dehydrogenase family protein n=1 Tax=Ornithinimicrobium faecis TaxID=2934158 RepID=A0ABY4YVD4_9MICO|nr:aldehyde dehydrogenase family protein [Ornithinimicrobium sp. HY1793]USQ80127.1 aldehyde dehydrogenase family protein [Ornithinimicrobium sp. HY1793]
MTINGESVRGAGTVLAIPNPATGELLAEVPSASMDQVDQAATAAATALSGWAATPRAERSRLIHRFCDQLEAASDHLISTIINEVGTPVTLAESLQIGFPIEQMRWYADLIRADDSVDLGVATYGQPRRSVVYHRPVGVVAAISAYNYPLHLGMWKVGAALAAGCTIVLMPSPRTPLAVLAVGRIARESGLPDGVLNVIVGGPDVGRALTENPQVNKISFTGSDAVGQHIISQSAAGIKRVTLELGGKSPAIILEGADLMVAANQVHRRYTRNAGQGCASPTRLLVHRDAVSDFIAATEQVYDDLVVGDPWDRATDVGPVIRPEHRDRIEGMVSDAIGRGARIAVGGGRPEFAGGWWVNPLMLTGLDNSDPIAQNEVFGPVSVLLPYSTLDEAIAIANDSRFGLNGYLYGDPEIAATVAPQLRVGTVAINEASGLRPDAPFGGFGFSGIGREGGVWGLSAFQETQHIQYPLSKDG